MSETLLLNQILWVVTPLLVGIVGFYIVRSMGKTDADIKDLFDHIEKLHSRINLVESDLNNLIGEHNVFCNDFKKTRRRR